MTARLASDGRPVRTSDPNEESGRASRASAVPKTDDLMYCIRVEGSNEEVKTVTCKTCSVKSVGFKWAGVAIETELQ